MRLMGGLAIHLRSESVRKPPFASDYQRHGLRGQLEGTSRLKTLLEARVRSENLFNAIPWGPAAQLRRAERS